MSRFNSHTRSIDEVGIILDVDKESLTVLNQYGTVVKVKHQEVRPRNEMNKAVASDRNGMLFSTGDQIQIVDGPPIVNLKRATVQYVFRKFVFLRSAEIAENKGIYVTTTDCVVLYGAKVGPVSDLII